MRSVSTITTRIFHNFMNSTPLLPNILPHFQTLMNFVLNTLPKPVLIALMYRLSILQLASRILPTIGADSWASDEGVHDGWDERPASGDLLFTMYQKRTKA